MRKNFIYLIVNIFLIFTAAESSSLAQSGAESKSDNSGNQCLICHQELELMPGDFSASDVHMHAEITCAGCHGGDPLSDDQEISMSREKGFLGIPAKKDVPKFCGKCHSKIEIMRTFQPRIATDQVAQYYTSIHGKKLIEGDKNVADCVSCHTAHNIHPAKDPRSSVYALNIPNTCNKCHGDAGLMKNYNIKSNQFEEYSKSVHGVALLEKKDIGSPACNDCHGNHGAVPPGVQSVSHVCGICHVNNMEYFKHSLMGASFEKLGYHGCEQCHGNHAVAKASDEMVGVGEKSICVNCHKEGDEGYAQAIVIKNHISELNAIYDSARTKLVEVQRKGMNDIEIGFQLQDAKQALIQSRTLVHTFDSNKVDEKSGEGAKVAKEALLLANSEINEYYTRRIGFGAATLAFVLLAIALYFKIKDMERKKSEV